jgi:hypothetical protein
VNTLAYGAIDFLEFSFHCPKRSVVRAAQRFHFSREALANPGIGITFIALIQSSIFASGSFSRTETRSMPETERLQTMCRKSSFPPTRFTPQEIFRLTLPSGVL